MKTKEEICDFAESLSRKYNPEKLSPFPYEKIAEDKNDLEIYLVEMPEKISGATLYIKETCRFRILVNKNKPKTRQNFTIAHELGHYFLHKDLIHKNEEIFVDEDNTLDGSNILFRLDEAEITKVETEANNFAASLIMPSELVREAWNAIQDVTECAKIFNVSLSAMSIRLERLRLI